MSLPNIHTEELIIRYLQGDITPEEMAQLDGWIHLNEENHRLFFQMKDIHDDVKNSSYEYNSLQLWQQMSQQLRTDQPENVKKVSVYSIRSYLKYAGIVLIGLLAGWGITRIQTERTDMGNVQEVLNEVIVNKGGTPNTVVLSDGSRIILNAASRLKYPSHFQKESRQVYLAGEGYFDIAPDEEIPFIVHLKNQTITVLGTTFNVEAFDETCCTITTLYSGSIAMETCDDKGEVINKVRIEPGQQIKAYNQTGAINIERVNVTLSQAWINNEYIFNDEKLATIVKRLQNYYNIQIILEDEQAAHFRYSGAFSLDQPIRQVLDIINTDEKLIYRMEEGTYYITKK